MTTIEKLTATPEGMKLFQRERLELELTELISTLMESQGVSRAELARRLGTTRANVTQLLQDGNNMTIRKISDVFFALDRSLRLVERPVALATHPLRVLEAPRVPVCPPAAHVVAELNPSRSNYQTLKTTPVTFENSSPPKPKPDPNPSNSQAA